MLPPEGQDERDFRPIVVGADNNDPYPEHGEAIRELGEHYSLTLDPGRCYPYRRGSEPARSRWRNGYGLGAP